MQLRPYQQRAISELRDAIKEGHKRLILCAPTGAGKTVMFSFMVSSHLIRGGDALIATDRTEIMLQSDGAFSKIKLSPNIISPAHKVDLSGNLHVGMVETIYRRRWKYLEFLEGKTLVIFDEAHKSAFDKLAPFLHPDAIIIGATATPLRTGSQGGLNKIYSKIVQPVDTPDLVRDGYLSRAITYGVDIDLAGTMKTTGDFDENKVAQRFDDNRTYEGVISNYTRLCRGQKALLFASNIASSKDICYKLQQSGYKAAHLDYTMNDATRRGILSWFSESEDGILCNVGILTAGYDCPSIRCIILYCATTSLIRFLQMCGRGSRIMEGKSSFTLLDFGNNVKRHGFWQMPRQWCLEKTKKRDKQGVPPIRQCDNCGALIPAKQIKCDICGHQKKVEDKNGKSPEVKLKLLEYKEIKRRIAEGATIEELEAIRQAKGYKPGWVVRQLNTMEEAERYRQMKGYKHGWLKHQTIRTTHTG